MLLAQILSVLIFVVMFTLIIFEKFERHTAEKTAELIDATALASFSANNKYINDAKPPNANAKII